MTDEPARRIGPGPFAEHLGFRIISADTDGAVVEADPGPEHCNGAGIVHGGYLASLLDSATGWAVHAFVDVGTAAPHVALSVQYIRIAVPGLTLVCRATCSAAGRRIGSTEAQVTQNGRLIARALATQAVLG